MIVFGLACTSVARQNPWMTRTLLRDSPIAPPCWDKSSQLSEKNPIQPVGADSRHQSLVCWPNCEIFTIPVSSRRIPRVRNVFEQPCGARQHEEMPHYASWERQIHPRTGVRSCRGLSVSKSYMHGVCRRGPRILVLGGNHPEAKLQILPVPLIRHILLKNEWFEASQDWRSRAECSPHLPLSRLLFCSSLREWLSKVMRINQGIW